MKPVNQAFDQAFNAVALDVETTGLDPQRDLLVLVTYQLFQTETLKTAAVQRVDWRPFWKHPAGRDTVAETLASVLSGKLLVGHNLKFDLNFLEANGVKTLRGVEDEVWDTMLAEQVLLAGIPGGVSLDATLQRHGLGSLEKADREWFIGLHTRSQQEWDDPIPDQQARYADLDVTCLPRLYDAQCKALVEVETIPSQPQPGSRNEYWPNRTLLDPAYLEMRALPAIAWMERSGMKIDPVKWEKVIRAREEEARGLRRALVTVVGTQVALARASKVRSAWNVWRTFADRRREAVEDARAGWVVGHYGQESLTSVKRRVLEEFNANYLGGGVGPPPDVPFHLANVASPSQLLAGLQVAGLAIDNTRDQTLERAARQPNTPKAAAEAIDALRQYREAAKLVEAFGQTILDAVSQGKGRVHPDWRQIGAATGRMACAGPL